MNGQSGRWIGVLLVTSFLSGCALGPRPGAPRAAEDYLHAKPDDLAWFQDAKFGLFVHWGPVSLKGTEIGWSRGGERRGHGSRGSQVPAEEYDSLYKQFNPTQFDADEWVAIAKAAGMKYLVFTTKHHDGFSMFDSKLTDYKITRSPFKRDIVAELADACHKGGLKLGFYYSPPDWRHPDYRTDKTHARYIRYLHGQLRELCTRYGKVDVIWFDGLGGSAKDWDSPDLFRMIRQLQPGVLINGRAGLEGDFDTPEQRVGQFQTGRAWETCMTIGDQWAWRPNDRIKPLKECLPILVRTVTGGGNLLFNVGPMPTGQIEPRQVDRLKEIGQWLRVHGESIYQTRGGPFKPGPWGGSTCRANTIYLHIVHWDKGPVALPPIAKRIVGSSLLTGGTVDVKQTEQGIDILVAEPYRQELDTVVVLQLDGPAQEAQPAPVVSGSVATRKPATVSEARWSDKREAAEKVVDDDYSTAWMTGGKQPVWFEVDLGKPTTMNRAVLCEAFDRVEEFELQCKEGESWRTFARGTTIGPSLSIEFAPVTAQQIRLNILKTDAHAEICEFQLFAPP